MNIEQATIADTAVLVDCWVALAADQRQYGSRLQTEANREPVAESIVRYIVADGLLVARDPAVVGFVMYGIEHGTYSQTETVGTIANLYVRPEARNRHIGSQLLSAAERALIERGAETVSLEVLASNEAAQRFYHRHDYRPHRVELTKRIENDTHSKDNE